MEQCQLWTARREQRQGSRRRRGASTGRSDERRGDTVRCDGGAAGLLREGDGSAVGGCATDGGEGVAGAPSEAHGSSDQGTCARGAADGGGETTVHIYERGGVSDGREHEAIAVVAVKNRTRGEAVERAEGGRRFPVLGGVDEGVAIAVTRVDGGASGDEGDGE